MSCADLLNPNELERRNHAATCQAKCNRLSGTFHQRIESFRLGMTTPQGGNRGYGMAVFVPFHKNGEFSLTLHCSIPSRFYHLESLVPQEKISRVAGMPRQPYLKNSFISGAVAADSGHFKPIPYGLSEP